MPLTSSLHAHWPWYLLGAVVLSACGDEPQRRADPSASSPPALAASPATVPSERLALCARPADDAVRDIFCKGDKVSVSGLRELLARLQIETLPAEMSEGEAAKVQVTDTTKPDQTAVFLAHSTALSGQLISDINPRAIRLSKQTLVAFQRGVQKVEIATLDRSTKRRNFYLLSFVQACNQSAAGCSPGDLYTLDIERDWQRVKLEDDEDLKNTPLDCRMCHKRSSDKLALLMREVQGPWTHFFMLDDDQVSYSEGALRGRGSTLAYLAAKGSESYAGVPTAKIRRTVGATLQVAVQRDAQPLQFSNGITLQTESTPRSAIWDQEYAAFKRGEQLSLPYFKQSAADPDKLARLSHAYQRYQRGELPASQLPDLADVFPDDPQTRAEIGLQTEPGATPSNLLIQACGMCHNDVLDPTLSRARFNIDLARMSAEERELAVARIELPPTNELAMPPHGMRQLDADGRQRLIAYLRADTRSAEDNALLSSAAKLGMKGPGEQY